MTRPNVVAALIVVVAAGCTRATAPTPPPVYGITGTVWVWTSAGIIGRAGSGAVSALVRHPNIDRWYGPVAINGSGRYQLPLPTGSESALVVAFIPDVYQPCSVNVIPEAGASADIHVVTDPNRDGTDLPPGFPAQGPLLTGQVYENTPNGRQPVARASVFLDAQLFQEDFVARARADNEGRYVLCGVPQRPGISLFVQASSFQPFVAYDVVGKDSLDIPLERSSGVESR